MFVSVVPPRAGAGCCHGQHNRDGSPGRLHLKDEELQPDSAHHTPGGTSCGVCSLEPVRGRLGEEPGRYAEFFPGPPWSVSHVPVEEGGCRNGTSEWS